MRFAIRYVKNSSSTIFRPSTMTQTSLVDFARAVDSFPYTEDNFYYQLKSHDGSATLGYITPSISKYLEGEQDFLIDQKKRTATIAPHLDTIETRNTSFRQIATKWRKIAYFSESLDKGWRDELYTVYNPTHTPYMQIERALSVLIGVITYGIHINGYIPPHKSSNGKLKMWVPRRSTTKPTYPGMLDNTVAGGLGHPYGIWETVIKECLEEAGLATEFIESHIRSVGVLLYMYEPYGHRDNVQPEVEYIYDLEFDNETEVLPYPEDGEAEDFTLMEVDELLERLHNHEFKPNCGLVVTDFLIRHNYITPESDENYLEIVSRCHRRMPFPTI